MDGSDQGKNTELVQLTTLDECIQQFSWTRMDFIKIDAEGAELHVIRGGKTFFSTFSPLVMFEAEHAGVDAAQPIVEALAAIGYKTYCLVPALGVLVPVHQLTDSDNNCLYLNLFGCKDDTAIRLAGRGLLVLETSLVTARSSSDLKGSGFWDLPYVQALHERWQETASDPARTLLSKTHCSPSSAAFCKRWSSVVLIITSSVVLRVKNSGPDAMTQSAKYPPACWRAARDSTAGSAWAVLSSDGLI